MILLISTGVRAGFYGVAITFFLYVVWSKKNSLLVHFSLATLVADIFSQLYVGLHALVFFTGDIIRSLGWGCAKHGPCSRWVCFRGGSEGFVSKRTLAYLSSLGPVGMKIMGLLLNIGQIEEWWVLRHGFGSFQRSNQIISTDIQYDDPGIIQLIFLDQGLLQGFCLCLFWYGQARWVWNMMEWNIIIPALLLGAYLHSVLGRYGCLFW